MHSISRLSRTSLFRLMLIAVFSTGFAKQSSAILIGFESSQGYSPGNLNGQPSSGTTWTSNAGASSPLLQVVSGTGVGGGNGLQVTQAGTLPSSTYRFAASNSDLGGTFLSNQSKIELTFQLRWDPGLTGSSGIGRFYTGVGTALGGVADVLSLDWYANRKIGYNSNGVFTFMKGADGTSDFIATVGIFYTVHAIVDYSTQTYTLDINGIQQNGGNGITFRNPNGTNINATLDLSIQNQAAGGVAALKPWTIDNISYALVPEPATWTLIGFGGLGVAFLRARRRKQ